ncbi:MAG: DUF4198 domain-containing protein [Burkholderiales bacterium]|nr:DUF4198 domain-containing protein [Burkholderiales bacterium]
MSSMKNIFAGLTCGATLLFSVTAHAHYLWLESDNESTKIFYGEAQELVKEKSPGKLDNIKAPKAWVQSNVDGKSNPVEPVRAQQYFTIAGSKNATAVAILEESLEVKDLAKHKLGFAKSNYYARIGQLPAAGAPASPLALDLQQRGPNTFVILYRGQPLKDAKLEVIASNTWMQEHKTDAQGTVRINTPWRGEYVLHVLHIDSTPGEFAGKKYEFLRNHLSYSLTKTQGADPGPAVPSKSMD